MYQFCILLHIDLHFQWADSIIGRLQPLSIPQSSHQTQNRDARVWNSATSEHLPTCHSKCPLHNDESCHDFEYNSYESCQGAYHGKNYYTHYISALFVDVILNALWSHPPDGDLLLTSSCTLPPTEVVSAIHVLCQTKVSHFDHSISINPRKYVYFYYGCNADIIHTHMQFLAARSRWTNLLSARYFIPLAIWWHMLSNIFLAVNICTCVPELRCNKEVRAQRK